MFTEKVCEQVVGFSAMAEDELFEVNGGYYTNVDGVSAGAGNSGWKPKNDHNNNSDHSGNSGFASGIVFCNSVLSYNANKTLLNCTEL